MKRLVVLSMTFLLAGSVMMGQPQTMGKEKVQDTKTEKKAERKALKKLEGKTVSNRAMASFAAQFGNVPGVEWTRSDFFDEAHYTMKGQKMTAFYDSDGNLVGTTSPKTFNDVPAKGRQEIQSRYKDYKIGPVIFFDDNEANETDMYLYGAQFDDADNYFVEITKGTSKIILEVNPEGNVSFFKELK